MANNANAGYDGEAMTRPSLLITRPLASATRFVGRLAEDIQQSVTIVVSPLLEIVPNGAQVDLSPYAGVVFTSSNAVALAPNGNQRPAYCVGRMTAERAKAAGWTVAATEQDAENLIAELARTHPVEPLLHLAGRHRRGDIAARLTGLGIKTDVQTLYDQNPVDLSAQALALFEGEGRILVPLFSPRSAAHFIERAPKLHNVSVVAISDAVADCCQMAGIESVLVVAEPTGKEMLCAVEKILLGTSLA